MKIKNFVSEGFYVNLDRKINRNIQCQKQLKKYELEGFVKRFSAIDAFGFEKKCDFESSDWYKCAEANSNSQLNIIKYAKEKNLNNILIFEDDFYFFENNLFNPIHQIEKAIDSIQSLNWDILYLGGTLLDENINMVTPSLIKVNYMLCAHAYILNNSIYDKILDLKGLTPLMDNLLNIVCINKYSVYPCSVVQNGQDFSDIGGHKTPNPSLFINSYLKPIKNLDEILKL
jgi:glycosyl transferase family 25